MFAATRTTIAAGVLIAGALALTGCSGSSQTEAEACSVIEATTAEAQQELTDGVTSFADDPQAGAAAITKMADSFATATEKLSNDTVKPKAEATRDALKAFAEETEKAADDPGSADTEKLTSVLTEVQTAFEGLAEVCTS